MITNRFRSETLINTLKDKDMISMIVHLQKEIDWLDNLKPKTIKSLLLHHSIGEYELDIYRNYCLYLNSFLFDGSIYDKASLVPFKPLIISLVEKGELKATALQAFD
jgi:hypothetical protein